MDEWIIFMFLSNFIVFSYQSDFPTIGDLCEIGSDDIEIGGKKHHFYLKCQPKENTAKSIGTWVIKYRSNENNKNLLTKKRKVHVCAQDFSTKETQHCDIYSRCLQPTNEENAYLQCDLLHEVWIKRYCNPGLIFSFDQQQCYGERKHVARQSISRGIACVYSGCVNSNQCSSGTCNSGYCCSRANSGTSIIICPNGGTPSGSCYNGYCSSGYTCNSNNICCPSSNSNIYTSCNFFSDIGEWRG
uniref:Uncharacterized protein n=1 Tax=Acrobeloides nanus TaxID=290746 RepID=A0A914E8U3_9BILA